MHIVQENRPPVLGIIGSGGVATAMLEGLVAARLPVERVVILAREPGSQRTSALLERSKRLGSRAYATQSLQDFLEPSPDVVVEAASHGAVADYAVTILSRGIHFVPASLGAFCDSALYDACLDACNVASGRLHISNGAVGGLDMVRAAVLSGNAQICYTARKPPLAWEGSKAEEQVDLKKITSDHVLFSGSARMAARDYPRNANVTAAIALAGLGFDNTEVELIVDPSIEENVHEIAVKSSGVKMVLRVHCLPSLENPRTSVIAGFSLARSVSSIFSKEVV